jgi:hypothetical protein
MKKVWKCDYCYKFDEKEDVIKLHEQKCTFNPDNKTCWTCKHHVDEGMPISGSMYVCQKGKSNDEMWEFEDKSGCDKWEI